MTPSRMLKGFLRRAVVSWRDQPTQWDIEALQANIRRVGLVISVRWALVAALAVFSVLGASVYLGEVSFDELLGNMAVPALALVFVLAYNTFYQLTYRRLGNIAFLNHAQLMFDMAVATVLIYYSGGVYSWFSAIYLLFILEGAFILPDRRHVWALAAAGSMLYGGLVGAEYLGVVPHVPMPFVDGSLHRNSTYVTVRYMWEVTMMFGTSTVGNMLMASVRRREADLKSSAMLDPATGLYDRHYFHLALSREVERASRTKREVSVLLIDIDDFGAFNALFGIEAGDRMLREIAEAVQETVRESAGGSSAMLDTVCRYGGEEFGVILTDIAPRPGELREPGRVADEIRRAVEALRVDDGSVTASVGVAVYPHDAASAERLLGSADLALSAASAAGGNRVRAFVEDEAELLHA